MMQGFPGECPADSDSQRMTKAEAQASIKDMGDFADFVQRLEKTHVWSEEKGDFVLREQGQDNGRTADR